MESQADHALYRWFAQRITTLYRRIGMSSGYQLKFSGRLAKSRTEMCIRDSAYLPLKEVLKDCPTLRYYTYTDGIKILTSFLNDIKDRNSADYKKYFDEDVYKRQHYLQADRGYSP